jgi:hypothetical protein
MYRAIWEKLHKSVCAINFFSDNGIKLLSLSGFRVGDNIVTDELIYKAPKSDDVVIQFVKDDGFTISQEIRLTCNEFNERINRLVEFENEGYALIELDGKWLGDIPSFEVEYEKHYSIGQQIAVIGYHIEQENLSIKNGIISSFFKTSGGKRYIQFDAAIKQGNSGSPLIDVKTGKVIGVVGYRLSAISKSYEAFKKIIEDNLKMLKKSEGKMNIMDVDPIQVLVANQHQLKQISKEFYRSSTMSFGYAYEIQSIENYMQIIANHPVKESANVLEK